MQPSLPSFPEPSSSLALASPPAMAPYACAAHLHDLDFPLGFATKPILETVNRTAPHTICGPLSIIRP